jgi:hypothetical protein
MTFQLRIDKNSFQFQIIFLGMNPIKDDAARPYQSKQTLTPYNSKRSLTIRR